MQSHGELLVALDDKLWKGVRKSELEEQSLNALLEPSARSLGLVRRA